MLSPYFANVAPTYAHDMVTKYLSGDVGREAAKSELDALPICDALFCEVDPIPVKAAINMDSGQRSRFSSSFPLLQN